MARSSRGESAVERGFGTDDTLDRLVCDSRSFGPASSAESERTAQAPRAARGTSPAPRRNLASQCKPIDDTTSPMTQRRDDDDESQTKKISRTKKKRISRASLLAHARERVWCLGPVVRFSCLVQCYPTVATTRTLVGPPPCWPWDGRRYLEASDDASRRRGPGARRRRPDPSGRGARATSFRSVP